MRVTFQSQFRDGTAALQTASDQLFEAQRQVSTGRRINKVSDDPTGTASAIAERNGIAATEQYVRAADSVGSRLAVVDTVLSDIVDKLSRVQTAALSGQGTNKTTVQRDGAVQELRGLRAALLDDMNTSFHGTYVFSGASATTPPYTQAGSGVVNAYAGSTTESAVDVGDGRSVTVAFDGSVIAKGSAATHIFDVMDALITAVSTGDDAGITTGIAGVKEAFTRATTAQIRLGNDLDQVGEQKTRLQQMVLAGTERLSHIEDADMSAAITNMSKADTAYKAAIGAVSSITRTSLMDYLK